MKNSLETITLFSVDTNTPTIEGLPIWFNSFFETSVDFVQQYLKCLPIVFVIFSIIIFRFGVIKLIREYRFPKIQRVILGQETISEGVNKLFTGVNITIVLMIIVFSFTHLTFLTTLKSIALPYFLRYLWEIWSKLGFVLLIARGIMQWFGVESSDPLFFIVRWSDIFLRPIIDLLNYAKLLLQVILALLSPRTQLGPSLGGYSLSLAMLFYLCSITIIQSNSIEVHLPFVINGTYEMDQFNFLFDLQDRLKSPLHTNDMVVWVEPFLNR